MSSPNFIDILEKVKSFNETFSAIKRKGKSEALYHSFWSKDEIMNSLDLRSDWEVTDNLIPFYGDWHDLICLDTKDNSIIELDDSRSILHRWDSYTEFTKSLILDSDWDDPTPDMSGVISAHFDF